MGSPRSPAKAWLPVVAASAALLLSLANLMLWRSYGDRTRLISVVGWFVVSALLAGQWWRTRDRS